MVLRCPACGEATQVPVCGSCGTELQLVAAAQRARDERRVASERDQTARDEDQSGPERDRTRAAADRAKAADDRTRAAMDREHAARDRAEALRSRSESDELLDIATTDDLTGAWTRGFGIPEVSRELERAHRTGSALVL